MLLQNRFYADILIESLEVDFVKELEGLPVKNNGVDLHKETIIHSDQGTSYQYHIYKDSER